MSEENIIHQDPDMVETAVPPEETVTPPTEPEKKPEVHDEEGEEHSEEDKPKKKTGSQRAREAAQRERERAAKLEGELEALKRQLGITKPETKSEVPAGKPRIDEFETHEAYMEALTDWKVDQKLAASKQTQEQAQKNQTWEQKKEVARAKYDDFDEVLDSAGDVPMSEVMAQAVLGSEVGGDIAYHFASHPEEARKIAGMTPYEAAKTIHKIESAFSETQKPKPTSAPKPPSPVKAPPMVPAKDADGMQVY